MQFGVFVATKIDDWQLVCEAEQLGYDRAWIPDSQMIWSDCYATLALAAEHTRRIALGTGVAIPGTRSAPVTAHSIASINRLAPGRVFLGIGTGHTAMRVMGMDPMPVGRFREYVRVVRGLLRGEEVDYTQDGVTRAIRFLHLDRGFIDVEHPVPIYVAANGRRVLEMTGELGDGHVAMGNQYAPVLTRHLGAIRAGAAKAGRELPAGFHTAALTTAVVLQPGERVDAERVVEQCGSQVGAALHYAYEVWSKTRDDASVPAGLRNVWQEYVDYVAAMETPAEKRYLQIHEGHCTYLVPAERRFVTAETIQASAMVGEPDELIARIRAAERAGLGELGILPPMATARTVLREFAERVIARY
ncbi:MAG TPA: LLM class flavin-dependent oxidoreductase [Candidatus Binatia bacterium]|jgi:alkanesulfonate monooxygenase SsuD/methylene tetrahydromethanopterin reductase-like flavin-dependent oxidoreductase (luciferase family)